MFFIHENKILWLNSRFHELFFYFAIANYYLDITIVSFCPLFEEPYIRSGVAASLTLRSNINIVYPTVGRCCRFDYVIEYKHHFICFTAGYIADILKILYNLSLQEGIVDIKIIETWK